MFATFLRYSALVRSMLIGRRILQSLIQRSGPRVLLQWLVGEKEEREISTREIQPMSQM